MPHDDHEQPIIIVKKRSGHAAHHGGSWKVAFADFVTSMMAFFLVMWLVAQAPEVKESVAGYFSDPSGFKKGGSKSILPKSGSSIIKMKSENSVTKELERRRLEQESRKKLQQAASEIMKQLEQNPGFAAFKKQVEIQMTAEGLRIQLLESSGETFFERGSAELKPYTKLLLKVIAQELGKLPNKLIVEGHTDNFQYADEASYTNWELSVDRCNSARRWMTETGLRSDQCHEVRGYADTEPKITNSPGDPRNRRIAIIVVNDFSGMNYLDKNVPVENDAGEQPSAPAKSASLPPSDSSANLSDSSAVSATEESPQ